MYLSGYGVECFLKAHLISLYPNLNRLSDALVEIRKSDPTIRDICGSAGHDLPYLLYLTKLEERFNPGNSAIWNECAKWMSTWRYDPTLADRPTAQSMVNASKAFIPRIDLQM